MRSFRRIVSHLSVGLICVMGGSVLMPSGAYGQTKTYLNQGGHSVSCIVGTAQTSEGRVTQCRLSRTQTFRTGANQMMSCAGGSWVRFFGDGALRFCRLATLQTLHTAARRKVSCAGGILWIRPAIGSRIRGRAHAYGYAVFNSVGALIACTLSTPQRHARRTKGGQWLGGIDCAGAHAARFWGSTGGLRKCVLSTTLGINVAGRNLVDCAGRSWASFSAGTGNLLACVASRGQSFTNTRNKNQTCRGGAEMWFSERGVLERCASSGPGPGDAAQVSCARGTKNFHASRKLKQCRLSHMQLLRIGSYRQVRCAGRGMASFAPNGVLISCRLSTVQMLRAAGRRGVSCAGGFLSKPPARGAAKIVGRSRLAYGIATFAPSGVLTACTLSVKQTILARDSRGRERQRVDCAGGRTGYFYLNHGGLRACVLPTVNRYATARRNAAQCMGGAWASFSWRSGGLISCIASVKQRHINTTNRSQACQGGARVLFAESGLLIRCAKSTDGRPPQRGTGQ